MSTLADGLIRSKKKLSKSKSRRLLESTKSSKFFKTCSGEKASDTQAARWSNAGLALHEFAFHEFARCL